MLGGGRERNWDGRARASVRNDLLVAEDMVGVVVVFGGVFVVRERNDAEGTRDG